MLLVTVKVRLAKRQKQHITLNLEELKDKKAVQLAAEVTNRFTALEAAHNEEDLWKGTKTVLLEVARETIVSVKLQKRNGYLMTLML